MIETRRDSKRAQAVAASPTVIGISHAAAEPAGPGRWRLTLYFIGAAGSAKVPRHAEPRNFTISGPGRGPTGIRIAAVSTHSSEAALVLELQLAASASAEDAIRQQVWTIQLVGIANVDAFFSSTTFQLATTAISGGTGRVSAAAETWPTDQNYQLRDYDGFRTGMLQRLAVTVPTWTERHAADIGVMLVELLAYLGDDLSYQQDSIATESALPTARLRTSLERHSRLLDYPVSPGSNARTFLHVTVPGAPIDDTPVRIPAGTSYRAPRVSSDGDADGGNLSFETMEHHEVRASTNQMSIYDWGASDWVLAVGATSAQLTRSGATTSQSAPPVQVGDVLIFADADPTSATWPVRVAAVGLPQIDPLRGYAYVNVSWAAGDALPRAFVVTSTVGGETRRGQSVVYGNNMLADEGTSRLLEPFSIPSELAPRVAVLLPGLVWRDPNVDHSSARAMLTQSPGQALPCIQLDEHAVLATLPTSASFRHISEPTPARLAAEPRRWVPRRDLIGASPFDRVFVVESDDLRTFTLRFGDGERGAAPIPGEVFRGGCRIGRGLLANIGAGLQFTADPRSPLQVANRVDPRAPLQVTNLVPAVGATAPEPTSVTRTYAPRQLGVQDRCVNPDDYVAIALGVPGVVDAHADVLWAGAWSAARVAVRLVEDAPLDDVTKARILAALEPCLLAGTRVHVVGAGLVPIALGLTIWTAADPVLVRLAVDRVLRPGTSSGTAGLFDPSRLGFGLPVYLADVLAAVMTVPGVTAVDPTVFGPVGAATSCLATGIIPIGPSELAELRDELGNPRRGYLTLDVKRSK